jgi:hypothetical protein
MTSESANGGLHDEEKTQTIRLFGSHETAEIAAAKLEANGIKCWVNSDDCGGMYPSLTTAAGVRLNVRSGDFESATALLDAQATPAEINQIEIEALASPPPKTGPLKKIALGQILIGFFFGIILCLLFRGNSELGYKTYYSYTADGKCYEATVYRDGHLTALYKDRNLDGKWDGWVYYEQGHVVRAEYDENFDGRRDCVVYYSNSLPTTAEQDTDSNGIPDEFITYTNGYIKQVDFRPNGSKFTTTREIFQNGVLTEIWRGGDEQGFFYEAEKYDPFFNKVARENPYSNPINTNQPTPFRLLMPTSK